MKIIKKLIELLTARQKKQVIILFFLMIGGMFFETIGVGLIIPVFTVLSKSDSGSSVPYIHAFYSLFNNPSPGKIITIAMIAMVIVYLIKNLYLGFLSWAQFRFANSLQVYLSQRLFTIYLFQPYTFHLQRNSAQLVRNVLTEVSQYQAAIGQIMTLFSELLVVAGITALLVTSEPVGAIAVFITLSGVAWLFNRLTKKKIAKWGEERLFHDGQTNQHLMQGLAGVKDVKILGREKEFLRIFYGHQNKRARLNRLYAIISNLPKLWLECLGMIGLALLVIIMIAQNKPLASIVPTLSLFAVASFRLMPSVNKILNAFQGLSYTKSSIEMIYDELNVDVPTEHFIDLDKANYRLKKEIKIENLTFYYPSTKQPALKNCTFSIPVGQSVGIIGSSGSGKSTLIDIVMGLLQPESGRILIDESDINQSFSSLRGWQNQIGYVNQSIYLTDDTLRKNVAFGINEKNIDEEAIERAIKAAQLDEFINSLPDRLETMVGERGVRLSGGQRQRIGIARALYHNPPVLVLDEATSALDQITEQGVMESVKLLKGKTIIIVAHRYSTIEHCDWIIKLSHGKLVEEGRPEDLLQKNIVKNNKG
jgi:ABC-type multidrug transport system fused ATPase/permease subunit